MGSTHANLGRDHAVQDNNHNVIIKELPPSGERPPLFIVGDVHGCARELQDLLKKARARVPDCLIIMVGDLFTKGPNPIGVYELIQEYNAVSIKGNHDWALVSAMIQAGRRGVETLSEHTQQTLHLIRHHRRSLFSYLTALPHGYIGQVTPHRKRAQWEGDYPIAIVHAGINPLSGLSETSERMLLTGRWVRWEGEGDAKHLALVHANARSEHLRHRERNYLPGSVSHELVHSAPVSSAPVSEFSDRFRWHELHKGPQLIVFGHDAKQGLFRKTLPSGRPICIGLDTGCTYGRSLTGYFPEFDDAVQVSSERTYFDLERNVILTRTFSQSEQFDKAL
jgi:hypothetical protein